MIFSRAAANLATTVKFADPITTMKTHVHVQQQWADYKYSIAVH
jgi:hypothetical protein